MYEQFKIHTKYEFKCIFSEFFFSRFVQESQEMYDFAEITNAFDWEIREDLDDAERDLEDNVSLYYIGLDLTCTVMHISAFLNSHC